MMPEIPWNLQGIDPDARARAEAAAQQAGVNVSQWLNSMIQQSATDQTYRPHASINNQIPPHQYASTPQTYYANNGPAPMANAPMGPADPNFTGWNHRQPFQNNPALEHGLSQINSQIGNLAARLDNLARASADTAIPPQNQVQNQNTAPNAAPAMYPPQAPQTSAQPQENPNSNDAIRDIENTLNNIVSLIEVTDSRTNKSLGDMHSQIEALKSPPRTPTQKSPSSADQPEREANTKPNGTHARTRFEARRDRRLKGGNVGPGMACGANNSSAVARENPVGSPLSSHQIDSGQADFVLLARSLEAALEKNNSAVPAVTSSDIDNLKAEIRALAGQISNPEVNHPNDGPNYQTLYGQLEQISSQLNGNSSVSGTLTDIEHKIGLLFDQIQSAQVSPSKQETQDFNSSAQLADIERKLNLLFEQTQQSQQSPADNSHHDPDEAAHLLDIERKVSLLFDQFRQSQQDMLEASRQIAGEAAQSVIHDATENAVRMAAEHVAKYLPERVSGNEIEIVRNLEAGLTEVRATAVEADLQTQRTLNAVQDSLHAILDRLTYEDTGVPQSNQSQVFVDTDDRSGDSGSTQDKETTVAPPVELFNADENQADNDESLNGLPLAPMTSRTQPETDNSSISDLQDGNTETTTDLAPISESARPLEPGTGRPTPVSGRTNSEPANADNQPKASAQSPLPVQQRRELGIGTSAATSLRNASTNEELLAAARRAARNAANTTTSGKPEKKSLRDRFRRSSKEPKAPAKKVESAPSAKNQTGDKVFGMPRKPVLLTAAAILLFVGSMQIYGLMANNTIIDNAIDPASVTTSPAIEFDRNAPTTDGEISPVAPGAEPFDVAPADLNHSELDPAQRPGSLENNRSSDPGNQAEDFTGSIPLVPDALPINTSSRATSAAIQSEPLPAVNALPSGTAVNPASGHEMPPEAIGNLELRQAAATGNAAAQFEVATRFAEGRGASLNLERAAQWYQRAAAQGLAPAQYRLGSMYEKGHGVTQDRATARIWYQRAAELGNRKAMHNLAVLYADGVNGEPDMTNAARWFRKAADFGLNDSQFNLGILYARGLGTPRNLAEAYKWLSIAAANGDSDASQRRDALANELDQQTLAVTRLAIQTWRPEPLIIAANTVQMPDDGWGEAAISSQPTGLPGRDIIQNTQKILTQLGFAPGPADGVWGPRTQTAIAQFQARENMPQTGQLTPQMFRSLQQAMTQSAGV